MHDRSAFNPFSAGTPLKAYGALRDYGQGYEYDGLPYVGKPHPFKEDDSDDLRPQLKSNACCAQFDLSQEADLEQYRAVGQKVCDNLATISFEEKVYDNDIKSWRVLMRWMEHYFASPKAVEAAESSPQAKPKTIVFPETNTEGPKDRFAACDDKASPSEDGSRYHSAEEALGGLLQAMRDIPAEEDTGDSL